MKTKKTYLLTLAAIMASSVLWGCGSSSTDPGAGAAEASDSGTEEARGGQTLRVTIQTWVMGRYDFKRIAEEFEGENPGVKVVYNQVDNVDVISSMLEWSQGETNCDLALGGDRSKTVPYAANNYVVEFTDENSLSEDFTRDRFIKSFLESGNADGVQYMIPLLGEVLRCVVDISMIRGVSYMAEDQTVTAPSDQNEMYEYAKNLTKDGQTGLAIDWGNNMAVRAYDARVMGANGNLYESDGDTLNFTAGPVKDMLQVWQDLVKDGYTATDVLADTDADRTNFKAGGVAIHIAPASRWIEAGELLGAENIGIIPIPGTDTRDSVSYIHGTVVPGVSENQELAIKFIKDKLLQEQFQTDSMNSYGKVSPMETHYEKLDNPYWLTVLDFTERATMPPLYKDYTKLDTSMQIELQEMLSGGSTIDEFSADMGKFMTTVSLSTNTNK